MESKGTKIRKAILQKLKSLIAPLIILAIILAGVFIVINYKNVEEEAEPIRAYAYDGSEEPVILENDKLKLELDPVTTQFSITVKDSGKVWYSNPQNLAEEETIALANELNKLQSTVLMTYSTENGLEVQYNSNEYSIGHGIYEIEAGEDYVKVNYSLGNVEKEFVIPPVITETELEALLANMKNDYANMVKQYYKKYDINKLAKKDNKEELLANYPVLATDVIYVLRDTTKDAMKAAFQGYFEEAGYTYEQYLANKELDLSEKVSDKPIYNISVIYRLDGDDFVVEVPYSEMEFPEKYPIYSLSVLPYFGAGGVKDEGFLFVPEGSGALINFNNGKTAQNSYYANMYGWDMDLIRDSVVHNTRTVFNTFGIANKDDSFICVLEEGAPYASIQADISGKMNCYNYVNAAYRMMMREEYDVGDIANSAVFVYIDSLPDEKIVQRYSFLHSGSYVDMAKDYKGYLENKYGDYLTMNTDTEAPAVVEILGAVDKVKQVFGVPVSRPLELTTYKEASAIIDQLVSEGINNLSVKMTGWCNGGENQKVLNSVKTIGDLGSKKDLTNMIANANAKGVDVYLDGVTHYAYDSNLFNGFFSFTDAARFISKERSELYQYSQITYSQREGTDSYYLLHSDESLKMMDNLVKATDKYNAGVSFRDTGMDLSADYYKKKTVSRQEAMHLHEDKLKTLADADKNVMINMGNDYAAVYSDVITHMDLKGSEYTILDTYVPFYEMALHGYVDYTGAPVNLSGNAEEEVLLSAEYGAGLMFTLMDETAFALQKTLYTEYYAADFNAYHDDMMKIYTRYNTELGSTFNQEMVGHKQVYPELSCTTYADGTNVYVNYSYSELTTPDGIKVPARDYKVVR